MFKKKNKRKLGFVILEYVIIGAIVLGGGLVLSSMLSDNTSQHMSDGAETLSDKDAKVYVQSGGEGYKIASLRLITPDGDGKTILNLGQSAKITSEITPNDVWNYALDWSATDSDLALFSYEVTDSGQSAFVTCLEEGKGVLTAKTRDGSNISRDVIVACGTPLSAFSVEGELLLDSDKQYTEQIVFENPNVTWTKKDVTFEATAVNPTGIPTYTVEEDATLKTEVADINYLGSGLFTVSPKQGGTINVRIVITDRIFDKKGEFEFLLTVTQIWSDWSDVQTNGPGEEHGFMYRSLEYGAWSQEYSEDLKLGLPEEVCSNGKCKTALAGYEEKLVTDPDPEDVLIRRTPVYRTKYLTAWSEWSTTYNPGIVTEQKTQYGYQEATSHMSELIQNDGMNYPENYWPTTYSCKPYDCNCQTCTHCDTCYNTCHTPKYTCNERCAAYNSHRECYYSC